jgi:hypothetical protein
MKMSNIRIPKRLKQRPQFQGLPIPHVTLIRPDGKPDFRVTNEEARQSVMRFGLCQLCGHGLGKYQFFVGGTASAINNAYYEPACHLDCLIYAMQVCPFIVGKMEHVDSEKIQRANPTVALQTHDFASPKRNPLWVIVKASNWKIVYIGKTPCCKPDPWIKATVPLMPEKMTPADWKQVFEQLL